MDYLNVALPKGRIGDLTAEMFIKLGYESLDEIGNTRKLILEDEKNKIRFFLVKPSDVTTYVEYGSADMGVVGKDVILEENRNLYELLDLGFGKCKVAVAGPKSLQGNWQDVNHKRVATKYPNITRNYFEYTKKESIEIIKLNGSIELAPLIGLSEIIVDIVETGTTLKENGLVVLETIADVSARLVVNRVSLKMKRQAIQPVIEGLKKQLEVETKL